MKRLTKRITIITLIAIPVPISFATGTAESKQPAPGSTTAPAQKPKYTFYAMGVEPGVVPFWATVCKGLKAAKCYFPATVVYLGLQADELNATAMANKLETARAGKPNGISTGFWFLEASD